MACRRGAKILWVFTGAAGPNPHRLAGLASSLSRLHMLTVALTRAGFEVARVYGILGLLRLAAPGGYYRELVVEESASGLPLANRVAARRYDVVIIAPCSSNTLAKIIHGVADTLASTVASQALKTGTPLVILPSEAPEGSETTLPCRVDASRCNGCLVCIPACPTGAVTEANGVARISLEHCVGCLRCMRVCPTGAVKCFERMVVKPSPVDIENLEKASRLPGVMLVHNVNELLEALARLGLCTPGVRGS